MSMITGRESIHSSLVAVFAHCVTRPRGVREQEGAGAVLAPGNDEPRPMPWAGDQQRVGFEERRHRDEFQPALAASTVIWPNLSTPNRPLWSLESPPAELSYAQGRA